MQLDGGTISGSGTLIVNTNGSVLLGANNHAENISMGSGGLIDVQSGLLRNEYLEGIWTNNLASLEVNAPGRSILGIRLRRMFTRLNGAGTIDKGQNNSNPLYIGVNNGSESRIDERVRGHLVARGHRIDTWLPWCDGNVLAVKLDGARGQLTAGADPYADSWRR